MLDVSRVLYNPRFNQPFQIYRKNGAWDHGRFVESEAQVIPFNGVVTPASAEEIMQLPEGDRSTSMMCFYSTQEIFVTHIDDGQGYAGTSDELLWRSHRYRITNVNQYDDYGYFKAYGVMMEGE
jgi:hypothetical protein